MFLNFICSLSFIVLINLNEIQSQSITKNLDDSRNCERIKDSKHEVIEPLFVIGSMLEEPFSIKLEQLIPLSEHVNCTDTLRIHFSGFGDKFVIDLVKNRRLISDRYFKISKDTADRHGRHPDVSSRDTSNLDDIQFYKSHLFLNLHNFTSNDDHCHYHGYVNGNLSHISAISIVNHKLLSGFFNVEKDIFYLQDNITNFSTILTKSTDLCIFKQDTQISNRPRRSVKGSSGLSPDNYIRHEPFSSNLSSLYVELLVVHDHSQYMEYNGNSSIIAERTMQIVNIMNAFYRQLNIFITLVGVVLWIEKDEIQLTEDGDLTLNNFLKYRYEKLLPRYHHDNAQLITSTSFNGSVVGKALKGPICTHEHSGGVNTDHSHSPAIVAVTLAHELGHNFGMEHDEEDKCKCPDEKCIMSSSSSSVHPKHWSSCSIEYLEDARTHGLLDCLVNRPEKVFGPICGNGFVEDGEDCDIGERVPTYGTSKSRKTTQKCPRDKDCELNPPLMNPCCDRQTCKFIANATCAQGPCCDLSKCAIYNATDLKVCRQREGDCDLEEVCDGYSEYCPPDVYRHDGIECSPTYVNGKELTTRPAIDNRSRAFCYNGKCASHESQCKLLWGHSGYVSKDLCYEQNIHGNTSGNCGYNRKDKIYESCEQDDAICGMLHCVHNQPNVGDSRKTGKLGYGFESASILTVSFFVMSNHAKIYCHGAIIDAGPDVRDPGLVPNGAMCGEDKMCLNQKCVPVYDIVYNNWCPSDCNGNGICDNLGICHCYDGTIGTSCYQFFGSNFHISLVLYIIIFFLPMIALIIFTINHYRKQIKIWWFLHNRKIALRSKAREPNQARRLPFDIQHKLSISGPIPLSHHSNTNRPFYETPVDPWEDTSTETPIQSPGYRLEPIKKQQNTSYIDLSAKSSVSATDASNLKPVRAAPPPPIPHHEPSS